MNDLILEKWNKEIGESMDKSLKKYLDIEGIRNIIIIYCQPKGIETRVYWKPQMEEKAGDREVSKYGGIP